MHTRDYKQHGGAWQTGRAEVHNAVRAHNDVLGGGIVAVPATVVVMVKAGMDATSPVGGVGAT